METPLISEWAIKRVEYLSTAEGIIQYQKLSPN